MKSMVTRWNTLALGLLVVLSSGVGMAFGQPMSPMAENVAWRIENSMAHHAGVFIDFGNGQTISRAISFHEPEITGLELLNRAEFDMMLEDFGWGWALCAVEQIGCFEPGNCFCGGDDFWGLYVKNATDTWEFAPVGLTEQVVTHGFVYGLRWGQFGDLPAEYMSSEILNVRSRVGLVVQHDTGSVSQRCVEFEGESMNGLSAMRQAGFRLDIHYDPVWGPAVCAIDGTGCTDTNNCWCAPEYWGLYIMNATGDAWDYAPVGIGALHLQHGDVIAWRWEGWGDPLPDLVSRSQLIDQPSQALLTVQVPDETTGLPLARVYPVSFYGQEITVSNLLAQSGLSSRFAYFEGMGHALCFLDGIGCRSWRGCFCGPDTFWSLYVENSTKTGWEFAMVGPDQLILQHGDQIGWAWSEFGDPPPPFTPSASDPIPGDLNGDGIVDALDLLLFQQYWKQTTAPSTVGVDDRQVRAWGATTLVTDSQTQTVPADSYLAQVRQLAQNHTLPSQAQQEYRSEHPVNPSVRSYNEMVLEQMRNQVSPCESPTIRSPQQKEMTYNQWVQQQLAQ